MRWRWCLLWRRGRSGLKLPAGGETLFNRLRRGVGYLHQLIFCSGELDIAGLTTDSYNCALIVNKRRSTPGGSAKYTEILTVREQRLCLLFLAVTLDKVFRQFCRTKRSTQSDFLKVRSIFTLLGSLNKLLCTLKVV